MQLFDGSLGRVLLNAFIFSLNLNLKKGSLLTVARMFICPTNFTMEKYFITLSRQLRIQKLCGKREREGGGRNA